ncbi:hypothetical protein RvY_06834, partial [Ramazzottius varieornatus]
LFNTCCKIIGGKSVSKQSGSTVISLGCKVENAPTFSVFGSIFEKLFFSFPLKSRAIVALEQIE